MNFINRETELKFLNGKWMQNEAQLVILYGKRRVGKTELCLQFVKDKPHLYFLCERIAAPNQLKKLSHAVGEYFKDEFISTSGFDDWETLFKYIARKNERMILIVDEFSYLAETDPAIGSIFQKGWDLYLKSSKIYLILLGSSISMMEKTVLFHKAPLYGRRTGQFLIKPFNFRQFKLAFPNRDFDEILAIYSMVGGTPFYWNRFKDKNYWDTIKEEILTKGEPLYEEVEFLLREELKEPRNYFVILEALSLGKHKLSEIINETGFDKGIVSRYLSILDSLQITEKEIPVTEKKPQKSRKGIYKIYDNFFHFWFQLIFRNKSLLEEGRIEEVLFMIKSAMTNLLSRNYEKIAGEILSDALLDGKSPFIPLSLGRWWDRRGEIDLVALNPRTNEILFGEVKWSLKPVGIDIYQDLKRKSQLVAWGKADRKEYFALFSKSGFTPDMKKLAKEQKVYLFEKDKLMEIK